ncbi:acyl-CoA/acyl-ACP dehydrogenase [Duganella dendranthematis]|jgi:alkylation response protein AidB-like acyl-CoA dehydrogenase|uniref:Acyl-CoA/acyl-ACP dehydrogenase n=1 Tax=Duganella dendranthematis TaxID=2728021 RepID=A0ABX6M4M8_9BURK|nr:acyl-CoA dehydrogenase family protein [Duganella dendranthematis]QJD89263.1 acyl-CoA/acyl-ACP dehydrogenase [Duganella dendranthematis]
MATLHDWLAQNADTLDQSESLSDEVMPALAAHGSFRAGVPLALGGEPGEYGDVRDAILGIADVARYSVTAAFVYWGQRSFIEYLLQSSNTALRDRLLPSLLDGSLAGATGLSNAMKFLSGMEPLSVQGTADGDGWRLNGKLAWITNLRPQRFVAAAAVAPVDGSTPLVTMFASGDDGVQRSDNLQLIAMRGSHTAAVRLENVAAPADYVIAAQAPEWLARVRPAFLGMQCGMSIGLATASLDKASQVAAAARGQLGEQIAAAQQALAALTAQLLDGVADGRFVTAAPSMFKLRIALADLVQQAVTLELQAKGGHAYLVQEEDGFARRWRESAFIPVITPSITQLQAALAKHAAATQ